MLLYQQIKLTKEAVEDTSEATEQMRKQNSLAEDTAKKQLRAYLDIFDIEKNIERRPDWDDGENIAFKLQVHISNFGNTPARNVVASIHHGFFPEPMIDWHLLGLPKLSSFDVPPSGRQLNVFKCFLSEPVIADIASGPQGLYILAHITYDEIFDDPHVLKFILVSRGEMWGDCVFGVYRNSYEST